MKKLTRFLLAWMRTYGWMALLTVAIIATFVTLHCLSGGGVREIGYGLLLACILALAAAVISFIRLARHLRSLELALERPPEEKSILPAPMTVAEQQWRELAGVYLKQYHDAVARIQADEREKSDYYTLWLHQIKTPLSALGLLAQSDGEIDRALMRQELLKLEQYAGMALSYQRLDSIHQDMELAEIALYPLCCQAVRKLRPLFQYGRIALVMEPFSGTALTDGKWLTVVLTQVLTNALKYTLPGGRITVTMPANGVLMVEDTGIGIRSEDVPRVFDRGFTGHTGRSHEKSTGIGLYLCKRICQELGHRMELTSRLGEGTVVTMDLRRDGFEDMG